MFSVNFTGLEKLQRDLEDAEKAFRSLDGTIATLQFGPDDPASVQAAIREMEVAIDRKTAPYRGNPMVVQVAKGLKETYAKAIRENRNDSQ
jgi:hypothetical protein